MAIELKPAESLRKSLKRMARKEIDDALDLLTTGANQSRDEVVHEARKSFKKIRALLRLVRPCIGRSQYRSENLCFRDAGRPLTEVRDARILIESLDKLIEHFAEHVKGRPFEHVRKELQANLRAVRRRVLDKQQAFATVSAAIREARERVPDWTDVPNHWSAIGTGLQQVHERATQSFAEASADPTVEKLHEWRKQCKYLRYQLELLNPIWPEFMETLADQADHLGDLLGDDHDLAVVWQMLADDPERFDEEGDCELLVALIDRRRAKLQDEAIGLGERFFQDRPRDLKRRLKEYWKTWQLAAERQNPMESTTAAT
jgi:CHAD domain-containing protein